MTLSRTSCLSNGDLKTTLQLACFGILHRMSELERNEDMLKSSLLESKNEYKELRHHLLCFQERLSLLVLDTL